MTDTSIAVAALVALAALALLAILWRSERARRAPAVVAESHSQTSLDDATGAVRSVQSAEVFLRADALEQIWSAEYLERLARTYWRFLARVTLGLIHVSYSEHERSIVLLVRPLRLLTFQAPEYEMDGLHGLVRWRIARGILVARRGRDRGGYLQIEVRREESLGERRGREPVEIGRREAGAQVRLHVTVEVANFYPSIASGLSRRIYDATQSRIHVIVTNSFLRSLRRLDLAESRVGRFRL
jgi:hypothetical protein